jgi:hypothetical protein
VAETCFNESLFLELTFRFSERISETGYALQYKQSAPSIAASCHDKQVTPRTHHQHRDD